MGYLEDIAHKPSADHAAMHLDQLLPAIGPLPLEQVHDGTLKPFVDAETACGLAAKSVNNAIAIVSAVLNRAARVWRPATVSEAIYCVGRLASVGRQGCRIACVSEIIA